MLIIDGEVIPDDDPRAVAFRSGQERRRPRRQPAQQQPGEAGAGSRRGQQAERVVPRRGQPPGPFGNTSANNRPAPPRPRNANNAALPQWLHPDTPLGKINQQLTEYFDPVQIGSVVLQPIMIVILVSSYLIIGPGGLIIAALLLYATRA
ncbi:hypothetical protein PTSG_01850 [Salpingoeca rosetta]|uniref:DUF4605 domain-containing protein n=1 Tax=Salpingoeca rosetta (strain ATCC 50818 / BSB-021) TaxID=946362 RepID=F2TZ49_SALR5|nr:uncharacterized protein PTSG_01850 [Salpingoeca rosetta]EGD78873.1 hypothetical protein PTSG_01850 [Salpingoeca rosetta]|eukprot:XP_004997829.1 hypothetical protein PTSG_01850 [Salpingoeca rosetta]